MGEERFNLNVARAFIGHHVNLHMKDGSVLVNVCVTDIKKEKYNGRPAVFCISKDGKQPSRIFLKEIQWMEQLNPFIFA
ncbi:MAG: hypothetical protein NWF11_08345 [Candidatus Bathyarchaeota archaeon]|nr:hypothetical protein [Candidatus Bathyarchaeota archaeon]